MVCKTCIDAPTPEHAASHINKSIIQADQFEDSLEILVYEEMKNNNLERDSALAVVLEKIRDILRSMGHEDFIFEREDWTQNVDDEANE